MSWIQNNQIPAVQRLIRRLCQRAEQMVLRIVGQCIGQPISRSQEFDLATPRPNRSSTAANDASGDLGLLAVASNELRRVDRQDRFG
jgi:hypothetical protein